VLGDDAVFNSKDVRGDPISCASGDTEMGAALSAGPKTSPQKVGKTIEGIRSGLVHVLADERAEELWRATRDDLVKLQSEMQTTWDRHLTPAT
jgi:hypothetical protein